MFLLLLAVAVSITILGELYQDRVLVHMISDTLPLFFDFVGSVLETPAV